MKKHQPAYLKSHSDGTLAKKLAAANARLQHCDLCPRRCLVNRQAGEKGFCGAGADLKISSYNAHFGEEPPISGTHGSGTIFFTGCNLRCVFCQNYPISQLGHGQPFTVRELADIMLELKKRKCHNLNLVTGAIYLPQILSALELAIKEGFDLPLVYNCSGYESLDALELLDGIVDIYLPDAKYNDPRMSKKYSQSADYPEINKLALKEMYRQVGDLILDEEGLAVRGLIIRHLVLPENIAGSEQVLEFIAKEISAQTFLSLMAQYHPAHLASNFPELSRRLTKPEYERVVDKLHELELDNGWCQEL